MPRPKKTKHVSIPSTLFEALILCRRELLAMYAQFNNRSFYEELNDGVAWKIVNDWEHSNMLTKTSPIGSLPAKLNIPYIANYIYSFSSDKCKLLEFLRQNEIRDRIQGLFDDDLEDDTVLANKPDFANVDQLAKSISKELQINLGPPSNYAWLKSATFSQLMTICGEIKETIEDEKEEDGSL